MMSPWDLQGIKTPCRNQVLKVRAPFWRDAKASRPGAVPFTRQNQSSKQSRTAPSSSFGT